MPRLLVFQHVAAEPLGTLDPLIRRRGHRIRFTNFDRHPDHEPRVDRYRGLIVLGVLFLMFNAATPEDLRPKWITGAQTWPLATNMGRVLDELAPKGRDVAGRLKPAFDRAVSGDRTATDAYEAREPSAPDHPERSR